MLQEWGQHSRIKVPGRGVSTADDEGLDGAATAAARLGNGYAVEEQSELAVEQARVAPAEDLSHEGPPW